MIAIGAFNFRFRNRGIVLDFFMLRNKGANQLRGNRAADQCLYFRILHDAAQSINDRKHKSTLQTVLNFMILVCAIAVYLNI